MNISNDRLTEPYEILEDKTNKLEKIIDKYIGVPIAGIDFILLVEKVESDSLLYFELYSELLTSLYNSAFQKFIVIGKFNSKFIPVEDMASIGVYLSCLIFFLINLFNPAQLVVYGYFCSIQLTVLIFLFTARRIINRKIRVSVDRLAVIVYLMERN